MRKLVLICSVAMAAMSTAQAATINVVPSADVVYVHDDFSVLVSGADFPETGGATLSLSFDPNIVHVTGLSLATGSPFDFLSFTAFDNVAGEIEFISVLAPLEGALPSGGFDAFRVDFRSVGYGAAAITLIDDGLLYGWAGADFALISGIGYTQADISVKTVPLPAAAWLLISGLGVPASTRRSGSKQAERRG
jgi:hypothetical protein